MPRKVLLRTGVAPVLLALVMVIGAAPASAVVPTKACGKVSVRGKGFNVRGHRVACDFARRWSARFLARGSRPRGWSCRRYRGSRIRFVCRRGGSDYYAVR